MTTRSLRIQDAGDDRAQSIKQDLHGEHAEEEDGHLLRCWVSPGERLRLDDLRREDRAGKRQKPEHDRGERKDVGGERLRPAIAVLFLLQQIKRQECRGQDAGCSKFVDHGRHVVGNVIRRGQNRIAQRERHRPCAHQSGHTRSERCQRDQAGVLDDIRA